jgi:hypothetical protein
MSLLKVANNASGTVNRICGICHSTFKLPLDDLVLVRPAGVPIEWDIDIGAYCTKCGDYRCERHIDARDGIDEEPDSPALPIVELFCTQCSKRVVFGP